MAMALFASHLFRHNLSKYASRKLGRARRALDGQSTEASANEQLGVPMKCRGKNGAKRKAVNVRPRKPEASAAVSGAKYLANWAMVYLMLFHSSGRFF